MLKQVIVAVGCIVVFTGILYAQNAAAPASPPPSGATSSGPATSTQTPGTVNTVNSTSTNAALDQLGTQLNELRASVDQALPTIRAFNQHFSQQSQGGLAGAVDSIFSHNRNSGQSGTGGTFTNVLSALGSLVSTNAQAAPSVNPDTLRNLQSLERDLGPVQQLLQSLVSGNTNAVTQPNTAPTPTGR